jgi:branched-chain amino acid transport system permease protein
MLQQLVNSLVLGSILLLFALGLSLAWGTLDTLNLAHGAIFIFGGYLGYTLGELTDLGFLPILVGAVVGGAAAAAVLELLAFGQIRSRMKSRRQAELSVFVAGIGASTALNQFIANRTSNLAFAPASQLLELHSYSIGGVRVTNLALIIVGVTIVCSVALAVWTIRSKQGRAARAVAYSASTSALMGVNVRVLGVRIMGISGALAGLAGLLLAFHLGGETVDTGQSYMVSAFAILVVGGIGSIRGAAIAAYLVAFAQTMIIAYGPSGFQDGVSFALIMLILVLRPQGLFARVQSERA